MSDAAGRPLLGPFGAHHLSGLAATHTGGLEEIMMITAPERRAGGEPTPQSDLYAAGAILRALLTGRLSGAEPEGEDTPELELARGTDRDRAGRAPRRSHRAPGPARPGGRRARARRRRRGRGARPQHGGRQAERPRGRRGGAGGGVLVGRAARRAVPGPGAVAAARPRSGGADARARAMAEEVPRAGSGGEREVSVVAARGGVGPRRYGSSRPRSPSVCARRRSSARRLGSGWSRSTTC